MAASVGDGSDPVRATEHDGLLAGPRPSAPVRVGVLGAADAGVPHLRALSASVPGARVVVVHDDGDARRVAELAAYAEARVARHPLEVVADREVDAVVLAGPDPLPALWECLEAGVPAYVEPAPGLDPEEVRALVSLEVALGRHAVQVGFARRHDPAHLALRREITDGGAGAVRLLRSADRGGRPERRTDAPWPHSLLGALDAAAWLLGEDPIGVRVETTGDRDALVLLTLRTGSGAVARVEVHDGALGGHDVRCTVLGSTGALDLTPPPGVRLRTEGSDRTALADDATTRFADAHRIGLTAWARSLRTGRLLGASLWDLYAAAHLAAAAANARTSGTEAPASPGPRPSLYDAAPDRVTAQPFAPRSSAS